MEFFFEVGKDDCAYEVAVYASFRDCQMYVEHNVIDEESDWEGSDYSDDADGVKFNDSKDERTTALDDGFGVNPLDERTSEENKKKKVVGSVGCSESGGKFGDEAYVSGELGSSDPDDSNEERGPKYPKFRKEALHANFEFEKGMEFNSLVEFKDVIRHWSILNGFSIAFVKNESYRVE
ncbi:hypothetical protein A2U01_0003480 [Trifolium medium]|uniref:Uncharacterized protein n=1 Tax=Trifolium medium TaxID=97028 RepID=A0A392M607_9FABA|nr:hypothetical protein [Trifolium medium]